MKQAVQHAWIDWVYSALEGGGRRLLIEFLQRQRWFGGKGKPLADVRLIDAIEISPGMERRLLAVLSVEYRDGVREQYVVPLSVRSGTKRDETAAIVELLDSSDRQWVCDATSEDDTWRSLYDVVAKGKELVGQAGSLAGRTVAGRQEELAGPAKCVRVLSAEQSNTSVAFDERVIMKLIRKVEIGMNPDNEVLEFLTTKTPCRDVPPLIGLLTYNEIQVEGRPQGTVGVLQRFVPNTGDGWSYTLRRLNELLDKGQGSARNRGATRSKPVRDSCDDFLEEIQHLGVITGNLHLFLSSKTEPEAFRPEPITGHDVARWHRKMTQFLAQVCHDLRVLSADQRAVVGLSLAEVDGLETACRDRFGDLRLLAREQTVKIRHHGDYHLGQVLKTDDGFVVIDFEGEPARPLEERRAKVCPLKDVAGMLRSFNYAAQATLKKRGPVSATEATVMMDWEGAARAAFLYGYRSAAKPSQATFLPAAWDDTLRVLQVYELDKALYELWYEMRNRPDWVSIPLAGIRAMITHGRER